MEPIQVVQKVAYEGNYRPPIPQCPYPPLVEIMTSCWQDNPNARPSFQQVWDILSHNRLI